jgi:dihydrofolate reductase
LRTYPSYSGDFMAKVLWDVSMSLDGFVADPNDRLGKLFDWYYNGDTPSKYNTRRVVPFPVFKLSKEDASYFDSATEEIGAVLAGRRTYDLTN